ncbi:TPA: hypothetical protein N0F65_003351 [Lagenidium giganteum]|uniref:Uncharacterized protein n=1 Tax=Lagenidium giganteum TaxID=4803 RepID=A0AAV2ZCP0_9STRA|nr:TPA: hypothetical protein N0F65_003351 [Lagenidium giganteum]
MSGEADEEKKRRSRFDVEADTDLLRAVARVEPYRAEYGEVKPAWEQIAEQVNVHVHGTSMARQVQGASEMGQAALSSRATSQRSC